MTISWLSNARRTAVVAFCGLGCGSCPLQRKASPRRKKQRTGFMLDGAVNHSDRGKFGLIIVRRKVGSTGHHYSIPLACPGPLVCVTPDDEIGLRTASSFLTA